MYFIATTFLFIHIYRIMTHKLLAKANPLPPGIEYDSFEEIITSPTKYVVFREYAAEKLCVETLLFYTEVIYNKNICNIAVAN